MSTSLHHALNKQVANWSLLYIKLHNYHWNVAGSVFFELHEKFETFYDEAAELLDQLAERLLAIGGRPVATLAEISANASLKDASDQETAEQMVQQLADDFAQLSKELHEVIDIAEKEHDHPTADMLTGICEKLEKHQWMLTAYLQSYPKKGVRRLS